MPDYITGSEDPVAFRRNLRKLCVVTALLLLCFVRPCGQLLTFSIHDQLFSYIPLVPFISVYLIWSQKERLILNPRPCWTGAALFLVAGAALLACSWSDRASLARQDYLFLMTLSLLSFFWGACLALLGWTVMAQIALPAAFLVFAVPLPTVWMDQINSFFQYTSAATAEVFFRVVGTPVHRTDLVLNFSGFALEVAPECSGIHSTMVLFMTAWIAGYMFLNQAWQRGLLVLIVIPLAILRNGFRIFVIGELCLHISHRMIDSPIHRKGGPLFFALAMIPFLFFLFFLRRFNHSSIQPLEQAAQPNT